MEKMTARDVESALLDRCVLVATARCSAAQDQREANVFHLASLLVQGRFTVESRRLLDAGAQYFAEHRNEKVSVPDVVQRGWVVSLPRFRDQLARRFAVLSHEENAALSH